MSDEKSLSRRELFGRLSRPAVRDAALETSARIRRYLRPPGAVDEAAFLKGCTGCQDCVQACPHAAIFVLKTEDYAAGTPIMAPDERPCHLCTDQPCVAACPEDVLQPFDSWSFGTVTVIETCFTFRGPECGACGGLCPTEAPALTFVLNRPKVDEALCIGCGICIEACPTTPASLVFQPRLPT